jgi:hypothetical protein
MIISKKIAFLLGVLLLCSTVISYGHKSNIDTIKFIPEEFNDIELGYYCTRENSCSPKFSIGMIPVNTITVNIPQKIIYKMKDENFEPIIPVCIAYMISERRGYKYSTLPRQILHIKKVGEESIYSGEIVDKDESLIIVPPNRDMVIKQHKERVKEAQKYSDEELDQGQQQATGGYMNVNLLEYIDISLQSGKYEIHLSFCGLESNRMIVEIVINE